MLAAILPEMESRLGADYRGAYLLRERERASQSVTCHCLSRDGWMMDDCISSNNTNALPVCGAACTGPGENLVCVRVCVSNNRLTLYNNTLTDSWRRALTRETWPLPLLKCNAKKRKDANPMQRGLLSQRFSSLTRSIAVARVRPLKKLTSLTNDPPQCDVHNVHARWCDASGIRK